MIAITTTTDIPLHYREDGSPDGPALVFANSLGTDLRLWDSVLPLLPAGLRIIRFDVRGHGLSDLPTSDFSMDDLVSDTEALLEELGCRDVVFVGLSIGGMIGQGLAAKRPDLIKALVLSNSAARMGDAATWQTRINAINANGIESIADAVLDRWFSASWRQHANVRLWRNMLVQTSTAGYAGCCGAIAKADLRATTASLCLPVVAIAGAEDQASTPTQVADTAALIPGSAFHCIADAGHLPCVEQPAAFADIVNPFINQHARRADHD